MAVLLFGLSSVATVLCDWESCGVRAGSFDDINDSRVIVQLSKSEIQSLTEKLATLVSSYVSGDVSVGAFANLTDKESVILKGVLDNFVDAYRQGVMPSEWKTFFGGMNVIANACSIFCYVCAGLCVWNGFEVSLDYAESLEKDPSFLMSKNDLERSSTCFWEGVAGGVFSAICGRIIRYISDSFRWDVEQSDASELFLKKLDEIHWFVFNSALSY